MHKYLPKAFLLLAIFVSCSSTEDNALTHTKHKQHKAEYIYRKHDEILMIPSSATKRPSPQYPWKKNQINGQSKISKEYFRCKGSHLNPAHIVTQKNELVYQYDCGGSEKHSLPLRDGKEFIYPILTEILNHIQTKTGKRVVVTSGHRCPDHNTYVDPTPSNQYSKHTIGAAVSFYVQGMENNPQLIIDYIQDYYHQSTPYQGLKEYQQFQRYTKDSDVSNQPWYNKEVFVKFYTKVEGRNFDNRHPYPYINIQVRYDRDLKENVNYSWDKAFRNYHRF